MLLVQYLKEKAVVNSQKLLYEDAVYENKEAKKLDYKEKIESTAKLIETRKAKLDELEAIFKPFKELKENFDQFNKAVKEERKKDIESTKKSLLSCKKAIEAVQAPLIDSASKTLDQNKTQLTAMKTVFTFSEKVKRQEKELGKVQKIIVNKRSFEETDKAAGLLKGKANEMIILETEKVVRSKKRVFEKLSKKYAVLNIASLNKKIKGLEDAVDEEKKSKDGNKKALIKRAQKKVDTAKKELKLQQNIEDAIALIARMNKNVLDAKAGGKMAEIEESEKKLTGARDSLSAANQSRLKQTRDVLNLARKNYKAGKAKGDVNMMNRAKKNIRKFKRKVSKIVRLSKARHKLIMASKKLDDDKYMADQDKLILAAKAEVLKAEDTGRDRAIKTAKAKRDTLKTRKDKQQKNLNAERISESLKELKLCKKNVGEAQKTGNLDLINIARSELKHARSNFAKSNVIKIAMAKKIMDEKEDKTSSFRAKKREFKNEVLSLLKKANLHLLAVKKEANKEKIA